MRACLSCTQVNNAVWRIEQPWIGVPLIHKCGKSPIRPSKPFDGRHHLRTDLGRDPSAVAADPVKRMQRVVRVPPFPIPREPTAPRCDVSEVASIFLGEKKREFVLAGAAGLG